MKYRVIFGCMALATAVAAFTDPSAATPAAQGVPSPGPLPTISASPLPSPVVPTFSPAPLVTPIPHST